MIRCTQTWPGFPGAEDQDTIVDAHVETTRRERGRVDHVLTLDASREGSAIWTKEITFAVDAPFDVPDLPNADPFVIAALFPAMGVGGTLRMHGRVSRVLIRNLLDYQSLWFRAAPEFCRPIAFEVAEFDDASPQLGANPKTVLAFTGGLDSLLALCRNVSGDAGPAGHDIRATVMIHGMGTGRRENRDPSAMIADLRRTSGRWGVPLAVVDTNIAAITGLKYLAHGTWLASCLSLFSGGFDVGLVGSSVPYFRPAWELIGSHPLLDPLLSGGAMSIRNDEGLYEREDKVALLTRYPTALEDLRVCVHIEDPASNCCRCEKCLRTMLSFIASGNPIPSAFPHGPRLGDIGIGMGNQNGLDWAPIILNSARLHGTQDAPAMQVLLRRYRVKRAKVAAKAVWRRLRTGRRTHRWHVIDDVLDNPDPVDDHSAPKTSAVARRHGSRRLL